MNNYDIIEKNFFTTSRNLCLTDLLIISKGVNAYRDQRFFFKFPVCIQQGHLLELLFKKKN